MLHEFSGKIDLNALPGDTVDINGGHLWSTTTLCFATRLTASRTPSVIIRADLSDNRFRPIPDIRTGLLHQPTY